MFKKTGHEGANYSLISISKSNPRCKIIMIKFDEAVTGGGLSKAPVSVI